REDLNGEDVRKWYDGYVYNPRFQNAYWTRMKFITKHRIIPNFEVRIDRVLNLPFFNSGQRSYQSEYVYHAFCLGMFVVARDRGYNVDSNHEAGKGRFVIRIVHKSDAVIDMAIVIEFKVVDDKESSESVRSN
ncbi:14694_t:CDS:2, partial [Funneliformis mosseae]